jgi:hypothetical protein
VAGGDEDGRRGQDVHGDGVSRRLQLGRARDGVGFGEAGLGVAVARPGEVLDSGDCRLEAARRRASPARNLGSLGA